MSDPDKPIRDRSHLATLLSEHPGAVPALLSLLAAGGSTALAAMAPDLPRTSVAGAVRWLTAERLVERDGGDGSLDTVAVGAAFRLTALGMALASSIAAIATLVDAPAPQPRWQRLWRVWRPLRRTYLARVTDFGGLARGLELLRFRGEPGGSVIGMGEVGMA